MSERLYKVCPIKVSGLVGWNIENLSLKECNAELLIATDVKTSRNFYKYSTEQHFLLLMLHISF